MLELVPITISDAKEFVARVHRHHKPPQGGLFAIACAADGKITGVAIIGRPVARMLDDGWTAEVTRLATDGSRNACSMLYGAAWRACRALGYRKLVTYILSSESGGSLKASGWKCVGECGGGKWSNSQRQRSDDHPLGKKTRYEMYSGMVTGTHPARAAQENDDSKSQLEMFPEGGNW